MRSFFIAFCLLISSAASYSQTRPDIDTITLSGLSPGIAGASVNQHVRTKLDTLFWDKASGAGLTKYSGSYFDIVGEYRIAYEKGTVSQVLFTATVKTASDSKPLFDRIAEICKKMYADPDVDYYNVYREMRWDGIERSVALQTRDNTTNVSLVVKRLGKQK